MITQHFVIPLDKDELFRTYFGQLSDREVVPLKLMSKEINAISLQQLNEKGPIDLIQEKLDVFLSVIIHGNKLELPILFRTFGRILKLVENMIRYLDKKMETTQELDLEQDEKLKVLSTTKILAYIMSNILCLIEDQMADNSNNNVDNIGKRKKALQKSDVEEEWEEQREKALEILYRWLMLPLKNLWTPPIVEDTFVGTVSQICYKILEKTKDLKSKNVRNLIFQILGTLVKRYNHGIACVVRIIQLAKFHEALAGPIGAGVVLMVKDCGCTGLIKEIAREIGESEPGEADARNFSNFLESIAITQADIILPILDNILEYLDNECYIMRNCAIGVMGVIVTNVLTGENLPPEKRDIRDECLDNLEDHIRDCNAYTRSKVLQTWQKLCCEGAIPLSRQNRLLEAAALRLRDKSANVRKQALQLLRAILQSNPFASKMNQEQFSQKLDQAKAELKQLQTEIYHTVGAEAEKEDLWNTQLPLIEEAINQLSEEEKNNAENEEENNEETEEIDIKGTFDKIQNYILKDKCLKAVKYLKKLFTQSGFAKEMKNVSEETKKEALLLFMYKIFMNSSSKKDDENSQTEGKKTLATDQEEIKQLDLIKVKKKLVEYLQNCYDFSVKMVEVIPTVEVLLYSVNPGDAIEACSFLGAAYQFQIAGALNGIRKALFQIFCKDQSVRDNLAAVYKEIYLHSDQPHSSRARALSSVKSLIQLLDGMQAGQSTALAKLIVSWRSNSELDCEALKVMWEMFSLKLPNTTPLDSRSALMLLTMAAQVEPNIITDNLDVLIKVGLGPRAKTDLLLARDTCRAFLCIKQDANKNFENPPIRYNNDHEMFVQITNLLKESFFDNIENGFTSFATDALNVIYHLADQPEKLATDILNHVTQKGNFIQQSDSTETHREVEVRFLARLLYLVGHVAIRQLVLLDQSIYKELKRRNLLREKKKEFRNRVSMVRKRKSIMNVSTLSTVSNVSSISSAQKSIRAKHNEDETEEGMEGATADDADAEHINMVLEEELLREGSYLSKFMPLILDVCQHPEKYDNEEVQAYGVLALSKLMTISSTCCENNMQLFVTILERSANPKIRANILIGLTDLMTRFPNQIEPWSSHIYGRLKDGDLSVRSTCVRMLSNMILGEMIRVKGQVAQLALCMVDENESIRSDAKQLFRDLSHKGNALYNVMPDILSCLSDPELELSEKDFQEIIKYILGLLQKDRQVDSIIEKLCSRFKLASTERQWRDLSYCLSLLKFSAKGIRVLMKDLPLLKDKIHNEDVQKALNSIIEQAKRRPEAKAACTELEEKVKELLENSENAPTSPKLLNDNEAMPPPLRPAPKLAKKKKSSRRSRRDEDGEDEDEEDEDYENRSSSSNNSIVRTSSRRGRSSNHEANDTTINSGSDEEESNRTPRKPSRKNLRAPVKEDVDTPTRRTPRRRRDNSDNSSKPSPSPSSSKRTRSSRT